MKLDLKKVKKPMKKASSISPSMEKIGEMIAMKKGSK